MKERTVQDKIRQGTGFEYVSLSKVSRFCSKCDRKKTMENFEKGNNNVIDLHLCQLPYESRLLGVWARMAMKRLV